MPLDKLAPILRDHVAGVEESGVAKGHEAVVIEVIPAAGERGPRFRLEGAGEREFIRMNSNSYLGLSRRPEVVEAEESAARRFGAGPGAVRFISGTYGPHVALERRLAAFHGRESAMIFSSAYATVVGILSPLTHDRTVVLSDELNHNCIINGMRLARPLERVIYPHLDMEALERGLQDARRKASRAIIVTDGVFSMRGDHAPLDRIAELADRYDADFQENVLLVVDDSHGVGAFGETGRGTEEYTGAPPADLLVATLGKALGVNGGYVATTTDVVRFLRETAPFYIYSNPITPAEAQAALAALDLLDGDLGRDLLDRLRSLTRRFETGLVRSGFEVIPGEHPVVPLMVRDTVRTRAIVSHLWESGVLATGLSYPVVPRGDESIRFQINADHTESDIDQVLEILSRAPG